MAQIVPLAEALLEFLEVLTEIAHAFPELLA